VAHLSPSVDRDRCPWVGLFDIYRSKLHESYRGRLRHYRDSGGHAIKLTRLQQGPQMLGEQILDAETGPQWPRTLLFLLPVALERNQHCGVEARLEGPKLEPRKAELKPRVLGVGLTAPPHLLGGLQEGCKIPHSGPGQSPGSQEFWCILGSSGELSCSPAMQNCVHDLMHLYARHNSCRKNIFNIASWKYTIKVKLRIFNEWIDTYTSLTINQQMKLANYCGGEKTLSPPRF